MLNITAYLGNQTKPVKLTIPKDMTIPELKKQIGAEDITSKLVLPNTNPSEKTHVIMGPSLTKGLFNKYGSYAIWNYDENKITDYVKEHVPIV